MPERLDGAIRQLAAAPIDDCADAVRRRLPRRRQHSFAYSAWAQERWKYRRSQCFSRPPTRTSLCPRSTDRCGTLLRRRRPPRPSSAGVRAICPRISRFDEWSRRRVFVPIAHALPVIRALERRLRSTTCSLCEAHLPAAAALPSDPSAGRPNRRQRVHAPFMAATRTLRGRHAEGRSASNSQRAELAAPPQQPERACRVRTRPTEPPASSSGTSLDSRTRRPQPSPGQASSSTSSSTTRAMLVSRTGA